MGSKKRILLKITGTIFLDQKTHAPSPAMINALIAQMRTLQSDYQFGIVVGGGNFFRGNEHGKHMGITPSIGHEIGMLATMMNGLILKDLLEQQDMQTTLFCAMPMAEIGKPISQQTINVALDQGHTLIFTGGTGNPFFTTDTNAVLRALQIDAQEIWKGTHIDGVYTKDPALHPDAQLLKRITPMRAMQEKLGVMDLAAYAMAEQYAQKIRIFDIFTPDALLHAARDTNFGSLIA